MRIAIRAASIVVLAVALLVPLGVHRGLAGRPRAGGGPEPAPSLSTEARARAEQRLRSLPGTIVRNEGQFDPAVKFCLRDRGASVFFTDDGFTLASRQYAVKSRLVGARAEPRGGAETAAVVNEYVGGKARAALKTYGGVRYDDAWPGIDVIYEPRPSGVEYTMVLAPGADPSLIAMAYEGVDAMRVDDAGRLELSTSAGTLVETPPRAFQDGREVGCAFAVRGAATYGFVVGEYDRTRELVIDPTLEYGTFVGVGSGGITLFGEEDRARALAVDADGNVYVTGETMSEFPTTPGAFAPTRNYFWEVFVTRINAGGGSIAWSTYLGGTWDDTPTGIAVNSLGDVYVCGYTNSENFPTTPGAFNPTFNESPPTSVTDGFVTKLVSGGGALAWSTYLGTNGVGDQVCAMAVDSSGAVYVTGLTGLGFPTTAGAFQPTPLGSGDAFVTKIAPDGASLIWSTFLSGDMAEYGRGIAVDAAGNAYVSGVTYSSNFPVTPGAYQTAPAGGADLFVTRVDAGGAALGWSTYLGGPGGEGTGDAGVGLGIDAAGNVYVGTSTTADGFPTTPGAFDTTFGGFYADAVVVRVDAGGATLGWSTYVGGSGDDTFGALTSDATGTVTITGLTGSVDFPVTAGAYDTVSDGVSLFVTRIAAGGAALAWSTFVDSEGPDSVASAAIDVSGNVYLAGRTYASGFPISASAWHKVLEGDEDGFVLRLAADGTALDWSTYVGGGASERLTGVAVDSSGAIYAVGYVSAAAFPVTAGALDPSFNGRHDAVVMKFSATGALVWSTFLGGPGVDHAVAVAVDSASNVYVTGDTDAGFPTTPGAYDTTPNGDWDVFATKLTAGGGAVLWSTLIGGSYEDRARAIGLDDVGALHIAGRAGYSFPTTPGAFDVDGGGGFVLKLSADGSTLAWSTNLNGEPLAMALDASGHAYLAGITPGTFPVTPGAYSTAPDDAFVARLNAGGAALGWGTYLGGSGTDRPDRIAVDTAGNVYVGGYTGSANFPVTTGAFDVTWNGGGSLGYPYAPCDAFVTRVQAGGGSLGWSTYLGGTGNDSVRGLTVDAAGNVIVSGYTTSSDFPVTGDALSTSINGWQDSFVTRIAAGGASLMWSTYLGGGRADEIYAQAAGPSSSVVLAGETVSSDFPTTAGAYDTSWAGGPDGFIVRIEFPAPVVNDGTAADIDTQTSLSTLSANWSGFGGGVVSYEWAIGTTPGATNTQAWTSVGLATSATNAALSLTWAVTYYVSVRATIGGGVQITATSDGVTIIDTSAPIAGTVNDGTAADIDWQSSKAIVNANWTGFVDPESGITNYEWAIGTAPGASNIRPFTSVGLATSATASGLSLSTNTWYYVSVRATNGVALTVTASSDGFRVDTSAPSAGTVRDGTGADIDTQTSTTTISANWSGFSDSQSGIAGYEWAIGTTSGGTNVQAFTSVGLATSATNASLTLTPGQKYWVTVRATNGAGLTKTKTSDGVTVSP